MRKWHHMSKLKKITVVTLFFLFLLIVIISNLRFGVSYQKLGLKDILPPFGEVTYKQPDGKVYKSNIDSYSVSLLNYSYKKNNYFTVRFGGRLLTNTVIIQDEFSIRIVDSKGKEKSQTFLKRRRSAQKNPEYYIWTTAKKILIEPEDKVFFEYHIFLMLNGQEFKKDGTISLKMHYITGFNTIFGD